MMANNFDEILSQLHDKATLVDKQPDGTDSPVITINEKREFDIPSNYNTVLAYAGDVNSQIVTFQIDRYQDGHDLGACAYKKLVWKNLTSDYEGASDLILDEITAEDTELIARWQVPAAAFAHAGQLEIAVSIYDLIGDKIGYSWNTATSTAFSVGATTSDLDYSGDDFYIPAKNEILYINENRQITMPNGYNPIIANYGDIGTSKVYFRVKSNIAGIDVLSENTTISVLINFNDCTTSEPIVLEQRKISVESVGDEYVILEWNVSSAITNNNESYFGPITIGLSFSTTTLKWSTLPFSGLLINEALVEGNETRGERMPFLVQTLTNNEIDKAPSVAAVNVGLAGKVNVAGASKNNRVYGVTNAGEETTFVLNGGNSINGIPRFTRSDLVGDTDSGGTFAVTTPTKQYHPANKKYVDKAVATVQGQLDTLGIFYEVVKAYSTGTIFIEIPMGAMATAYIESGEFSAYNVDGTLVYAGTANNLTFIDENWSDFSSASFTAPDYIQIPENARQIRVNCEEFVPGDVGWDAGPLVFSGAVYFQVKRGN